MNISSLTFREPRVALVDYGMGNLHSVERACTAAGLSTQIVTTPRELVISDAVILPGVGAFGDAMRALRDLDLVAPLRELALSGRPIFGICLGMQLLMTSSCEFGEHDGLDIVQGQVEGLAQAAIHAGRRVKVPHVGWNRIMPPNSEELQFPKAWENSPLAGAASGEFMYFVHSYFAVVNNEAYVLSRTTYGGTAFCSSLMAGNVWGCQFHPELSGRKGIEVYRAFGVRAAQFSKEMRRAA